MKLIADSGSTKTDWCLLANSGKYTRVQTEGMNPYQQSAQQLKWVVGEQFLPQVARELWAGQISQVHFYGAGCTPQKIPVLKEILSQFFRKAQITVESDMAGAARSLFGNTKGIACILGTGSNSCLWDGEKIAQNVPSLGFILDDEGSGSAIGKRLTSNILKNQLGEAIKEQFLQRFNTSQAEIIEKIYRQPMPNRFLASLSLFAAENIQNPQIAELVRESFRRFIHRNLKQYPEGLRVGFIGSIAFYYQDILRQVLSDEGYEIAHIRQTPMEGLIDLEKSEK